MDNNKADQTPRKPEEFVNRRRRNDPVSKSIRVFAVAGWFCLLAVIIIIDRATPASEDFFTRMFGDGFIAGSWNQTLVNAAFITVMLMFCASVAGLLANTIRHRRKTDRYRVSIIALGIISLALILIFIFNFYI